MATEQQPVLVILATDRENEYPKSIKLCPIPVDNKNFIGKFFRMKVKMSKNRILNTDGKTTFGELENEITLKSEKINYKKENHRLKWQNIISGNIKNNINGIYHGVPKRSMPLFLHEQEWRFNHRKAGKEIMNMESQYITHSFSVTNSMVTRILDISEPYFSKCV